MIVETHTGKEPIAAAKRQKRSKNRAVSMFFRNPKALTGFCIFSIFAIVAIFAPLISPYSPTASNFQPLAPPAAGHLLGTTQLGQDVFSQFIWGSRTSMVIGLGAGIVSTLIGILIGVTAGYRGGIVDSILNSLSNIFLVMPGLALLIIIESYLKTSTPYSNGLIIALTGWAWGARVFRSMAMTIASRDFIVAARLSGASTLRIMFTEIVPNMTSVIVSNLMYACLGAILFESGLAFLGFENIGLSSWGTMLYWASTQGAIMGGAWWWFVPPGIAIAVLGSSFALMNFGIDQVTNPRLRVTRRTKLVKKLLREIEQGRLHGDVRTEQTSVGN